MAESGDAPVLAGKGPHAKPRFSVLLEACAPALPAGNPYQQEFSALVQEAAGPGTEDWLGRFLRENLGTRHDLKLTIARDSTEVLRLAQQQSFDLFILLTSVRVEGRFSKNRAREHETVELAVRLKHEFPKPVMVLSDAVGMDGECLGELARAGVNAYSDFPYSSRDLVQIVDFCLKPPPSGKRGRSARLD